MPFGLLALNVDPWRAGALAAAMAVPNAAAFQGGPGQATLPSGPAAVRIDSGAVTPATGWRGDVMVSGGTSQKVSGTIAAAGTPADREVYRTVRVGTFSYAVTGLTAGATYVLRLHFLEPDQAVGARQITISTNGRKVLSGLDIRATTGGLRRAMAQDVQVRADAGGRVALGIGATKGQGLLAGLELLQPVVPAPASAALFPRGKTVNVMAMGDSITFGIGDGGPGNAGLVAPRGGYRFPLWDAMAAQGWSIKPVGPNTYPPNPPFATSSPWNGSGWAGWPGWSVRDLLGVGDINTSPTNNVDRWMATYSPDVILLHIGTNGGSGYATRRADFEAVIAKAQRANPKVVIVLAQIIQNRARTFGYVTDINAMVRDIVRREQAAGRRVYTVDMSAALTRPADYWDDVHPSSQGYRKMALAWLGELRRIDRTR